MTDIYDFSYEFDAMADGEGFVAVIMIFYLIYALVVMGISIAQYVLYSLGAYTIAKRRGIKRPWLAWVPVGSSWLLGCISDQYQYVVKGKVKNKRKALLVLSILSGILSMVGVGVYIGTLAGSMFSGPIAGPDLMVLLPGLLGYLGIMMVVGGISVAAMVIEYIALYDLYTSCEPKNNILYLILSIFLSVCMPLLVFLCRKKDLGMPPRKPQPVEAPWQPAEPPKELWENNPEV